MRWRFVLRVVGVLLLFLSLAMMLPLLVSLYYAEAHLSAYLKSIGITLFFGFVLYISFRKSKAETISQREGMAVVAVGWTLVGLFGAFPFYFHTGTFSVVNAVFESVSGFTTTGSSILNDVEILPKGLLLWRSLIQWLGGMGIIVLSVAILPFLGIGGMQLYKAEVPSPVLDKLKPRIRDTAVLLWKVYALFTLLELILLAAGGMSIFEAVCHAFTTMPTGGFSTKTASLAHFDSLYLESIVILFMMLAGINFSLHYQFLKGRPLAFWRDAECRFFVGMVVVLSLFVSVDIFGSVFEKMADAFRFGIFQVLSIITTTGFASADYETWPAMSQLILFFCMFFGASAGSTGGGMKIIRIMVCFKYCYKELFALIHPQAVRHIKLGGKPVPEDITRSILGFLSLYVGIYCLAAVLLAGLGVDFVTSLGAVAATLGNIGPGFGLVGPSENFAQIPQMGKWLLIWCMLLGRLEIYTVIILLVPEFWRK